MGFRLCLSSLNRHFVNEILYPQHKNIKIHYLCTWHDILDEIKKEKKLENDEIDSLEKFLFNSENWTKNG